MLASGIARCKVREGQQGSKQSAGWGEREHKSKAG